MKIINIKYFQLTFLLLLLIVSCSKDEVEPDREAPLISITNPQNNANLEDGTVELQANVTDNVALKEYSIKMTNQADGATVFENTKTVQGLQASINETIMLDVPNGGDFELQLTVRDESGNSTNNKVNFQVASTNMGTVDLNFRVQYGGETLVMFEEVFYPEPQIPITVSLVSAFISNITLLDANGETTVLEIERFKINEKHSDMATAEAGATLSIPDIPLGNYTGLKFGIGVPEDMNAKSPVDFPQNHPLFFSGEYWDSWDSYIFFKIEGKADMDMDGVKETPIALHGGSNEAFRAKDFTMDFSVEAQKTTTLVFTIDVKDIFDNNGTVYDLVETPQIHSLSQIPQTKELADNLVEAFQ